MLRRLFCVIALALPAVALSAGNDGQPDIDFRHSIYVGYGINNVFSIHNPDFGATAEAIHLKCTGSVMAGYEYRISKMFGVCGDFSWCGKTFDEQHYDLDGKPSYVSYGHKDNMFSILAGVRGIWLDIPHFALYSTLKLGASIYSLDGEVYNNVKYIGKFCPYFHLVPVGVEGSYGRWKVFLEGGFGLQGFVMGGVRVCL